MTNYESLSGKRVCVCVCVCVCVKLALLEDMLSSPAPNATGMFRDSPDKKRKKLRGGDY